MSSIQDYYTDLSKEYNIQRSNRYFRLIEEIELAVLKQYISVDQLRVLELGCGTGIFLEHFQNTEIDLYGLDYTFDMLQVAKSNIQTNSAKLLQGNAQNLPYSNQSFDIIYSLKVLAHVPLLKEALCEVQRVLRPQGIAILEFYNRHSLRYLSHRSDYFHQWYSPDEIKHMLHEANLEIITTYGARTFIPFAQIMDIPFVRTILGNLEKRASGTKANNFSGYYITVCRNKNTQS